MILSCSIPYNDITLLKDLHVWLSILFVAWFILEWFLYIPVHLNKNSILFFINIGLSFVFTFMFGHITGFCEIYFYCLYISCLYSNVPFPQRAGNTVFACLTAV